MSDFVKWKYIDTYSIQSENRQNIWTGGLWKHQHIIWPYRLDTMQDFLRK